VDAVIDQLVQTHIGRDLIVVGHFGQILTQLQRADRLTAEEAFAHRIDNLSVSEIHKDSKGWGIGKINQTL